MFKVTNEQLLDLNISVIDEVSANSNVLINTEKVVVTPKNIAAGIELYLQGGLSAERLVAWASILVCNDCFVSNDGFDDEFEVMWYVLQRISTPFLDGEITPELMLAYKKELLTTYSL